MDAQKPVDQSSSLYSDSKTKVFQVSKYSKI